MTEVTATEIAMGSDVPEWLITVEPGDARAHRGRVRFCVDVTVFETPDTFFVIPKVGSQGSVIDASDTTHCIFYAGSKPVHIVQVMVGIDPKGAGVLAPFMPIPPQPLQHQIPPPKPAKPTFWDRLREQRSDFSLLGWGAVIGLGLASAIAAIAAAFR